ncbi:hypothetical protein BGW80DRAFT_646598 [Lactifluus volemus]|nr:hypothetical protein BGW80DRAFT_646598 [Lactifluus volemus]
MALLIQCGIKTVKSIFNNTWKTDYWQDHYMSHTITERWTPNWFPISQPLLSKDTSLTHSRVSQRYCAGFIMQLRIFLDLIVFCANKPDMLPSLPTPSLYSIDRDSRYNGPFELDPDPSFPPWLRNGLVGTPFADLSFDASRPWGGYYIYVGYIEPDFPMFFDLRFAEPPFSEPDCIYFDGEGHDDVGEFSLRGSCDTLTGAVWASKAYREVDSPHWYWSGMLTPFGMVGVWGEDDSGDGGWWWSGHSP